MNPTIPGIHHVTAITAVPQESIDFYCTTLGLRLTKECLNHAIDAQGLEAAIAMEDRNQILASSDGDFQEGVQSYLQRRPPEFRRVGAESPPSY